MNNDVKLSILIPTFNAGNNWLQTLESISQQSCKVDKKIIVDSGSTDQTIFLAKQYGFEVKEITKAEFNHGGTRQFLADSSYTSDVFVFLTQDAILASPDSIKNIVQIFDNQSIGMAYGRQLPHKNAKTLEIHARLFNYPAVSHIRSFDDIKQFGFKAFFCSNSFAAYSKVALEKVGGFPSDSIMGEDAIVAAKMLLAGYSKAYVADATVFHSHSYTLIEEFRRYFDIGVFHEQNKWLIINFGKPSGEGVKFVKSELSYIIKNDLSSIFKSFSSLGAKWLGYKTGKFYKIIPKFLIRNLSMFKFYWK